MGAVLTLSAVAVAADGKTITATVGGGTGTGLAITNTNGIQPHFDMTNRNGVVVDVLSVSVAGTTLTINLTAPIGTGEVFKLDFAAAATLSDSGGNTPTGQTNLAITNNSLVAVTVLTTTQLGGSVEFNGNLLDANLYKTWTLATDTPGSLEFVTDATEICATTLQSVATTFRLDGAAADSTARAGLATAVFVAKPLQTAALGAGKHLVTLTPGQYFYGLRLSGGTRTLYTVPTTKATMLNNTVVSLNGVPQTSLLTLWNAYRILVAGDGSVSTTPSAFVGMEVDVRFTGTGVEIASLLTNGAQEWVASIDGAVEGAILPATGDASNTNVVGWIPLAKGLAAGSHTIAAQMVAANGNTPTYGFRVINGTVLSSAASIADTTLTVPDVTYIHTNDWIKIDRIASREWRQVTGISGAGPYTLTLNAALAKAHSTGAAVTSYEAAAGSMSVYSRRDLSARRILAIGDSNTQAHNDYGAAGTPDSNGNYYSLYDPRTGPLRIDGDLLNWEVIDCGIQGRTSAVMAGDVANFPLAARNAYDFVTIWAGTNDINSTSTTPAAFQTNVQTIVTGVLASLRAGGLVILMPPGTPSSTNAGGLNLATCATALQNIANANPTQVVYAAHLLDSIVAGDIDGGLHWHLSGQAKIAANLMPYFIGLLGQMFLAAT